MLFYASIPARVGLTLTFIALLDNMPLGRTRRGCSANRVRVNVGSAVAPGSPPRCVVDDDHVRSPVEAVIAPPPRLKRGSDADAEIEADGTAHGETAPGRDKHHARIVVGHVD